MTSRRPALTIRTQLTLIYGISFALATTVLSVGVSLFLSTASTPAVGPSDPQTAGQGSDQGSGLVLAVGLTLACGLLVAGVLGWLVAGRMLAPIRRIGTIARETASRNLHARVALTGPRDEIKQLADTFDGMLARLERSFEAHRRFAANASHELLTPLTTSRAILEVAAANPAKCDIRELTDQLLAVNAQSERLIETLLDLARAEHGVVNATPTDLAQVAERAWAEIRPEADGLTVDVVSEPALVDGDPALLDRLAVNLLRNAVRHNHSGGHVQVRVAQEESGPTLTVSNTGQEVPAELLGELFEPFVRAVPRTRGGHGLGMAIILAVTEAHHGTVTAAANPGGGLTVTIRFPAQRPRKAGSD